MKTCRNCYHRVSKGVCACREQADIIKKNCLDWAQKKGEADNIMTASAVLKLSEHQKHEDLCKKCTTSEATSAVPKLSERDFQQQVKNG